MRVVNLSLCWGVSATAVGLLALCGCDTDENLFRPTADANVIDVRDVDANIYGRRGDASNDGGADAVLKSEAGSTDTSGEL